MGAGAPTKYDEKYCEQARKLCLLGYTDKELADFFEVAESTVNLWKIEHPQFSESIKKGKDLADAEVALKLYERATGYEHQDVDIKMYEGGIIKTQIIKHYPPDTGAAIFWLKNRRKLNFKDKNESDINITGITVIRPKSPKEKIEAENEGFTNSPGD